MTGPKKLAKISDFSANSKRSLLINVSLRTILSGLDGFLASAQLRSVSSPLVGEVLIPNRLVNRFPEICSSWLLLSHRWGEEKRWLEAHRRGVLRLADDAAALADGSQRCSGQRSFVDESLAKREQSEWLYQKAL